MSQQPSPNPTSPTASSLSLATTATNSSTTTLLPKKKRAEPAAQAANTPPRQTKDFEASYAALSTSYGFGGSAPTKPAKKAKKSKSKKGKAKDTTPAGDSNASTSASAR
ncbi:hypothetical protein EIP91_002833 [Steccherinum ochraceum]|uniref:Uncharacterized protein n=1 Tax=Steccherinum ochraceum TaxID=92696 RepID=A0A4R0RD29_9APHY|nr:hypothetical protein EIP91_002833 [Steccherinum ochraceum]